MKRLSTQRGMFSNPEGFSTSSSTPPQLKLLGKALKMCSFGVPLKAPLSYLHWLSRYLSQTQFDVSQVNFWQQFIQNQQELINLDLYDSSQVNRVVH